MNSPSAVGVLAIAVAVIVVGSVIIAEICASITADKLAETDDWMALADALDPPDQDWLDRLRSTVVDEARRGGFVRPTAQDEIDELRAMWSAPTYQRRAR